MDWFALGGLLALQKHIYISKSSEEHVIHDLSLMLGVTRKGLTLQGSPTRPLIEAVLIININKKPK